MKTKLRDTSAYGLFVHNPYQQPMKESHIRKLQESIREHGFLSSKPLTVVPGEGTKFIVVDGHHRLEAARRENVPVKFVVEEGGVQEALADINTVVRKWSTQSLVSLYVAKGNPHYVELVHYVEKGIMLAMAASLLVGQHATSGNAIRDVRDGTFKVKTRTHINTIVSVMERLGKINPGAITKAFLEGMSALLFLDQFDVDIFIKRVGVNPRMLMRCSNRDAVLEMIEEIYNFRSHDKIPLKHLAEERLRERKEDPRQLKRGARA